MMKIIFYTVNIFLLILLFYFLQYSAYSRSSKYMMFEEYQEKAPSVDKENFTYNCWDLLSWMFLVQSYKKARRKHIGRRRSKKKFILSIYIRQAHNTYTHTHTANFGNGFYFILVFLLFLFFLLKYNFLRASTFYALWLCWCVYKEIQNRHKYTHRTQSRQ